MAGISIEVTLQLIAKTLALLGLQGTQVQETRAEQDELGMSHVRFVQMERGVHVAGGEVVVHYDANGNLTSKQQRLVAGTDKVNVVPYIDAGTAATIAKQNTQTTQVVGTPELVIRSLRLAYDVQVHADLEHSWRVSVDAHTGEVFAKSADSVSIVGSGLRLDGTRVPLNYSRSADNKQNELVDATREAKIRTSDAKQLQKDATLINSAYADSWDRETTGALGPGAAVSAHVNVGTITDYFQTSFSRSGWDGKSGVMNVWVHVGDSDGTPGFDNAIYSRNINVIAFGDGKKVFKPLAAYLDVTAHEYMHAVTNTTAALEHGGQTGALNESISDAFGAIVEHSVKPDPILNWQIGEGTLLTGATPIRDMSDPSKSRYPQPWKMSDFVVTTDDDGGVHINAGIPNFAAYLAGSKLGWNDFARVWFRADTLYLTANADFAEMAQGTLLAAKDFGLSETSMSAIDCAWKTVGVLAGTCDSLTQIPGGNPITTPNADGTPQSAGSGGSSSTEEGSSGSSGSASTDSPSTTTQASSSATANGANINPDGLSTPSADVDGGCGCRTSQSSGGFPAESWLYALAFVLYQLRGITLRGGRTRSRRADP